MNNKIAKILTIVVGVIGIIGFYFFIMVMKYGEDAIKADEAIQAKTVSPFVNFAFGLIDSYSGYSHCCLIGKHG